MSRPLDPHLERYGVAIIGMTGRFPGATDLHRFWQNLRDGIESISFFSDEELRAAGVDSQLLDNPQYVKARGVLDGIEMFDAAFFGFNPREAETLDPQHRLFLECGWESLENAGYDPERYPGSIGVYAGTGASGYLLTHLLSSEGRSHPAFTYQTLTANDKDHLATRLSYKLGLRGPSLTVQTACSTSLVAVQLAYQGLLTYQCDMALAGAVSIGIPRKRGYLYQEGMIFSPDGHCRAFDAKAGGTLFSDGVALVVLKRLADALQDGDRIHAVIRGAAINNDGSMRAGYTAPGVEGQAEVIAMAHAMAEVDPETITYVEAHGTGTPLGDPIEVAALTKVYRAHTDRKHFCAIGSLKSNIGHLNTVAGVAGLIKTVLSLQHKRLPPSLHFEEPNPNIDFEESPFYVNTKLSEWRAGRAPRRAGVSSFGIGGTNAHVILEEAPPQEAPGPSRPAQLLVISARSRTALEDATANLISHLQGNPDLCLPDVAYTLGVGRKQFDHRRTVVCSDRGEALKALESQDPTRVWTSERAQGKRSVAFMFSGQGAQYVYMGRGLYESEATFRDHVDACSEHLAPQLGLDLRTLLYPGNDRIGEMARQLNWTRYTQPALFVIEYALARLWMKWGVEPRAMIGHSVGEYVAACLAGVFSLEEALALVAARGRLMQDLPGGAMLAIPLPEREIQEFVGDGLSLAATNAPASCVISGSTDAIDRVEHLLAERGTTARRLRTSHAFHSAMTEPILEDFAADLKKIELRPPQIPYVSNVTGTWITAEEATDPAYWTGHLRRTVRFGEGVQELLNEPGRVLLEVGPGQILTALAKQQFNRAGGDCAVSSLRHPEDPRSDLMCLLTSLGHLWRAGVQVDWPAFWFTERRCRIPLPTYPFERQRYWLEAKPQRRQATRQDPPVRKQELADWFYSPSWKRSTPHEILEKDHRPESTCCWLVFTDDIGLGEQTVERLRREGHGVVRVSAGSRFRRVSQDAYTINPRTRDDYHSLFAELKAIGKTPERIGHFWSVTSHPPVAEGAEAFERAQYAGFYSLLFLAQALGAQAVGHPVQIEVVSNQVQAVTGEESLRPEKGTILGPCKVLPQEYPSLTVRHIDVVVPKQGEPGAGLADRLIREFAARPVELTVAYRGNYRWVQGFESVQMQGATPGQPRLRERGAYLITGGLGGLGLVLAGYLADAYKARLILAGRSPFPDRSAWASWLTTHDDDDPVSRKIRHVQALEALGSDVLVLCADVSDQDQADRVVTLAAERFGALHGVIHAAGLVSAIPLQEAGEADCQAVFAAKVNGLYALAQALRGTALDFAVVTSSLSSVLGGLGLVAYAAANAFLDLFAQQSSQTDGVRWMSINWDRWRLAGKQGEQVGMGAQAAELFIAPEEGIEAWKRLLSHPEIPQVVVSTGDLHARIDQWIRRDTGNQAVARESEVTYYSRPAVTASFVAPRNGAEQIVARFWQELLGIDQIGIHDNFFEMGGNSLIATQLVARLRRAFGVDLALRGLLEAPTVGGMAQVVEARLAAARQEPPAPGEEASEEFEL